MNTRIVMLGRESFQVDQISLDLIARFLPDARNRCGRHLRNPDGSRNVPPEASVPGILFQEYLKYLRQYQFRYKLSTGNIFWTSASVGSPQGNCQTVASNFLYLLWAFGWGGDVLGIQIVEVSHPTNEKIVTRDWARVNPANLCFGDAHLLGESRGTRSFKVNPLTNAIEPMIPGRNPFLFHAISYLSNGGHFKYYDARTGAKYVNGATDLFEGFEKGADLEYGLAAPAPRLTSMARLKLASTEAFVDPRHPERRMYLLPRSFDKHRTVAGAVGDYSDGGNWIFVDEPDWAGTIPEPGTQPPTHVRKMFEFSK